MANTKSAAKQARAAVRRREQNRTVKTAVKKLEKEIRTLVKEKKMDEANTLLPKVVAAYDKAAKRKIIHKNKSRRKSSRISKLLKPTA